MKKTLALIFTLLVIVTCFAACGGKNGDDTSTTSQGIESIRIPEENLEGVKYGSFSKFTAVDLAGNKVDESIFKGKKLTMINFWTTYCIYCIDEMPDLNRLHEEYADKDFQIIGVVCDVSYAGDVYSSTLYSDALDIVESTGITYKTLLPSKSLDTIKLSEVYSIPETIFVDENGNIVGESFIGSRNYENWKAIVDSVLGSME